MGNMIIRSYQHWGPRCRKIVTPINSVVRLTFPLSVAQNSHSSAQILLFILFFLSFFFLIFQPGELHSAASATVMQRISMNNGPHFTTDWQAISFANVYLSMRNGNCKYRHRKSLQLLAAAAICGVAVLQYTPAQLCITRNHCIMFFIVPCTESVFVLRMERVCNSSSRPIARCQVAPGN